jgi:CIC family chloride channel protein
VIEQPETEKANEPDQPGHFQQYSLFVKKQRKALLKFLAPLLPFLHRHWIRALKIRERIRFSEETFHLVLAGIIGVVGGLVNLAFYLCTQAITLVVTGHVGDVAQIAEQTGTWQRILTPSFGALASGLILFLGLRLTGNQGSNNLLEVVVAGDGRLRLRSALVKAFSSVLSISTGASIGREGSITQMAAVISSKMGQIANWPPYRLRLLVACGAASGMAAAYNAPVAGAVFAAQIVLGNFSMNFFAPLVFSSVIATMISRSFFGLHVIYEVPAFDFTHVSQLPWFIILGILSGGLAAAFLKMLHYSEQAYAEIKIPIYTRMMIAGLIVGILALEFPDVWGNGYGAINQILKHPATGWFLIGLFCAKLLATLVTVGSGTVGGVLTPTLFLGAGLGSIFGFFLQSAGLSNMPMGAFALVGMGSVLAATMHAPLLAMIMIFEISLNYSLMPPLMLACAVATLVGRGFHPESIYTEPLRIKGLAADRQNQQLGAATQKTVGELMREPVQPVAETATLPQLADRFLTSSNNFLPVIDDARRLIGIVALQDLKSYLNAGQELTGVIASDVMRAPPACLMPNQHLLEVLPTILNSELRNVPVVNNATDFKLVGAVLRTEALSFLSETIASRNAT